MKNANRYFFGKAKEIEKKMKNSFVLIRQDVNELTSLVDAMRDFLKKKERQFESDRKKDLKLRNKFQEEVDEFSQKVKQLRLAFARVKELEGSLVTKKDLAKIEDKIRNTFRDEMDSFRDQEKEFKKHINDFNKRLSRIEKKNGSVGVKKTGWFFRKRDSSVE